MPLTLVFKRSKSFVSPSENDKGERKFIAQANPAASTPAPFWVSETETFKHSIKDGSIVNLTPPHLMPGYKVTIVAEPVADAEADPLSEPAPASDAKAEDDMEQTELPKAAFGAQPMTPVAPAVKLGIQGGAKKVK